ncbi:MAG: molybdenum cofactor biosynthesis protein MoaE [Gammaproteobacteria bacterium]|nr:molybdenum cofactor biosynthesis protein MoaE [Gammaproteobacteria bacterium]
MDEIRVQSDDFSLADEYLACGEVAGPDCGAIAAFVGLVRHTEGDAKVTGLHLEHYPGMTEKSIEKIVEEARNRWSLQHVRVVHRIGVLPARSQIVLVVVASSHRPDAFAACEFIMDFLKTEAVFWKKEMRSDGDIWIKSTTGDYARRDGWESGISSSIE